MKKSTSKDVKICGGITAAIALIIVIVFVSLFLTIFKPRDPVLIPHPTKLQNVSIKGFPVMTMNATLNMIITIHNPNYGSFKFKDTNSSVSYRGIYVTGIQITGTNVPGRTAINITTSTNITADKIVTSPYFFNDLGSGQLNMTTTADMDGKVTVLKVVKFRAKVLSNCDITIYMHSFSVEGSCVAKLKL